MQLLWIIQHWQSLYPFLSAHNFSLSARTFSDLPLIQELFLGLFQALMQILFVFPVKSHFQI